MYKPAIVTGVILAALAVTIGAFGAHGLKDQLDAKYMDIFEKGVSYQFYHSLALIAAGILHQDFGGRIVRAAAPFFGTGILLFSGSLYLMAVLSIWGRSIGAAGLITPLGGLCFIAGWIALLAGLLKKK